MIVGEIVTDAFQTLGKAPDGGPIEAEQVQVGISKFNEVVSKLNLENFFLHTVTMVEHPITEQKYRYTIGIAPVGSPPADIVAPRPANIQRMYFSYSPDSVCIDISLVAPADIYLYQVARNSTSAPLWATYVPDYPLGAIQFPYGLQVGGSLQIVYSKAIDEAASMATEIDIPAEYKAALTYSVALALAVRYGDPEETVSRVKALADLHVGAIKRNTLRNTPFSVRLDLLNNSRSRSAKSIWNLGTW